MKFNDKELEELLKIIKHYGINNQQRKLEEEVFELQEAITAYENDYEGLNMGNDTNHIAEEIADVAVLLNQFIDYYDLDSEKIQEIANYKIRRQLERIKNEVKER